MDEFIETKKNKKLMKLIKNKVNLNIFKQYELNWKKQTHSGNSLKLNWTKNKK